MRKNFDIILHGHMLSSQSIYWKSKDNYFITHKARKIKNDYISQVKEQYKWPLITSRVCVSIKLFFPDRRRRDWDNFHKLTMDSLQWIVLKDDAQIVRAEVEKRIDKYKPRCEINIRSYCKRTWLK